MHKNSFIQHATTCIHTHLDAGPFENGPKLTAYRISGLSALRVTWNGGNGGDDIDGRLFGRARSIWDFIALCGRACLIEVARLVQGQARSVAQQHEDTEKHWDPHGPKWIHSDCVLSKISARGERFFCEL